MEEKYSRIIHDWIQGSKQLVTMFTTKTLPRVLYGMIEERLLFRKDWKKDNAVTRNGHLFGEVLSP